MTPIWNSQPLFSRTTVMDIESISSRLMARENGDQSRVGNAAQNVKFTESDGGQYRAEV